MNKFSYSLNYHHCYTEYLLYVFKKRSGKLDTCMCLHIFFFQENRPNLLPTMYARLYLLKALHFVMTEGLHLLGVTPATQL